MEKDIKQKYAEKIFILKNGDLEKYLKIHNKGLSETIKFCNEELTAFLKNKTDDNAKELRFIIDEIIK